MKKFTIAASFLVCVASGVTGQTIVIPKPTGQFVPGFHEFEFLDTVYPSYRADDSEGRRLLAQVWYPACHLQNIVNQSFCGSTDMGRRRFYLENGEGELYFNAAPGENPLVDELNSLETDSYLNAPVASDLKNISLPVIVFSHGLGRYVSQNIALMQELASQGYAVFALAHPGFSSRVLYSNGDVATFDEVFLNMTDLFSDTLNTTDIKIRFESNKQELQSGLHATRLFPRFRDDQLALTDYLLSQTNTSSLLGKLTGKVSLNGFVYMGHSYGGAAAASSAQIDDQARCALNMDGYQYSPELFGKAIQVPLLTFVSDRTVPYFNEFFYEPLESMGSDPKVTRVLFLNVTHDDFWDLVFLPEEARRAFLPEEVQGFEMIDGQLMHEMMVSFILGFFSTCHNSSGSWTPESSFQLFNGTQSLDVTYVAKWAKEQVEPSSQPKPAPGPTSMAGSPEARFVAYCSILVYAWFA